MSKATFVQSALLEKDFPRLLTPWGVERKEIALIGRSNVGKSSLLNHLTGCHQLAYTSKRPGKTAALQFFTFGDEVALVDFPGYGYAKASQGLRHLWAEAVQNYFKKRKTVRLLFLLLDIRRDPQSEENEILNWAAKAHIPTIVVLTKSDQVKASEMTQRKKEIETLLSVAPLEIVSYSVKNNNGRMALMKAIQGIR